MNERLEALNEARLPVTDYLVQFGECEYVYVPNNPVTRQLLAQAGFTQMEVARATEGSEIDISILAFDFARARMYLGPALGFR